MALDCLNPRPDLNNVSTLHVMYRVHSQMLDVGNAHCPLYQLLYACNASETISSVLSWKISTKCYKLTKPLLSVVTNI